MDLALDARTEAWYQRRERVTYVQSSAMLTEWKQSDELAYLNEVSSVPLQQALRHLQGALASFYGKRAGYPRFKSRRRSRQAAEYTRSAFRWPDGRLTLAKMDAPLDIRWSRPLPEGAEPSTVTVSRDAAGRWHVSLLCECPVQPHPAAGAAVGIDAGITSASACPHVDQEFVWPQPRGPGSSRSSTGPPNWPTPAPLTSSSLWYCVTLSGRRRPGCC